MLRKKKKYLASLWVISVITGVAMLPKLVYGGELTLRALEKEGTMPIKEEFEETIEKNPILKNAAKEAVAIKGIDFTPKEGEILSNDEMAHIIDAPRYLGSYGPKVIRNLHDFKGKILLVGGERKSGTPELGVSSIAGVMEADEDFFDRETGVPITTPEQREAYKKRLEGEIAHEMQVSKDLYYVSNINNNVGADLIASAINKKDMKAIPNGYFEEVIYENVDCPVFLFKETWQIMERITKPNGVIKVHTGLMCSRLIPTVVKGTKWEKQVNEQINANYKDFFTGKKLFELKLINRE